jgi:hypothetical protein
VSPVKIEEEKEIAELHVCPYSLVVNFLLPYPSEMSSTNFSFLFEMIIF